MFELGDKVECIRMQTAGDYVVNPGYIGYVTFVKDQVIAVDNMFGYWGEAVMFESAFVLLKEATDFDLKKNPWFIRTGTKEKSEACQKWLFEQGVEWSLDSKTIKDYSEEYLTNTYTNGLLSDHLVHGIFCAHKLAKEIILEFETTVKSVTYPSIKTEQDKKIKELKETIDKAQQQLEEMMSK